MIKFLQFIFYISFFSISLTAQWTVLNPHPTPNVIYASSAVNENHFVGVTGQGEAVVTTNGGNTWHVLPIGGNGIYRGVHFLNENTGWVVGSFQERLHKTTDDGLTWVHQPNAPDTTKYGVFFITPNIGWSVGFNGFIIKTTNGGDTWFSQSNTSITKRTLYGVCGTDVNTIYIVGSTDAIIKSTDGGTSWTPIPQIFSNATNYRDVFFPVTDSGLIGFVVGDRSRIAKTIDGGSTWLQVNNPGGTVQFWSIQFNPSFQVGVACGASSQVWRSTDHGNTWQPITVFPSSSIIFYSVRFASNNVAYLSGSNGNIYKSTDAGLTWNAAGYRFTESSLDDICFADNNNGYVVGTNFLARTTNGGVTFQIQDSPFSGDINEVVVPSPNTAIAGADGGNVIRTTNGGTNWSLIPTGITGTNSDILAIDFINNNLGRVAAYNSTIAKTTDGGLTWSIISAISGSNPWSLDFVDSLYGWISGTGEKIFATTDGGNSWVEQFSGGGLGTYGISFIDRNNGIAGGTGGNTYYTNNGGSTWNSAITPPDQTIWGIHYVSSPLGNFGMAVCASGYVFKTTDGGRTWSEEPRQTINTFGDVWMTNAANAWFAGNGGVILKYYEPSNIPVELSSFTSRVSTNNVTLIWNTETESNNYGFDVERIKISESSYGKGWIKLGFIKGNGTTSEQNRYSFPDNNLSTGKYQYRLKQIDFNGTHKYYYLSGMVEIEPPDKFELTQNFPNPFNPVTVISYKLPFDGFVSLKVYNAIGKEIAVLVNKDQPGGYYEVKFNANEIDGGLSSGIYYYRFSMIDPTGNNNDVIQTRKMVFTK